MFKKVAIVFGILVLVWLAFLVLMVVGLGTSTHGSATGITSSSSAAVRLTVSPRCLSVRTHAQSMTVTLSGARPSARYAFSATFSRPGFGGGNMGVHQANRHGVVHFTYPGPTKKWEVGKWTVSARYRGRTTPKSVYTVTAGACSTSQAAS